MCSVFGPSARCIIRELLYNKLRLYPAKFMRKNQMARETEEEEE